MRVLVALMLAIATVGCSANSPPNRQPTTESPRVSQSGGTGTSPDPTKYVGDVHDEYHVVIFSYQNNGWRPKPAQSHTFATWVKSRNKQIMDQVDISWGPLDGGVARASVSEVPGRNKCLAATLRDVTNHKLAYWVLKTDKTFFDAAHCQRDSLKLYRAIDGPSRPNAVNCIHACSDVAGYLDTGTKFGIPAGQAVAEFYLKTGRAWTTNDRWVIDSLKITNNCRLP
jgi:hypothetical protein